jgi:peptide/nickel transport system substrate-binding protein
VARALAATIVLALLAVAGGAEAQAPKRGGTIVSSRPGITCLNPFGPCGLVANDPILMQVLEGAFEVGPDLAFRPNLVTEVEIGRNPFTLTYVIRPEARWSDGVPVTASDFRFTYRAFATRQTSPVDLRQLYAKIRRVAVLGPKTLRVELAQPFADWRDFFHIVLPRHVLAGQDLAAVWRNRIDDPQTGEPIGSGPFLVGRLELDRQLTIVRNPRYWGPHASYTDHGVLLFLDPRDLLGPVRRNEVDLSGLVFTQQDADEIRRTPGWRVVTWPALGMEHLAFRVDPPGHPALRNKLVRRALAYGIDREEIARRANAELGARARPLDSTVFLASEPFYKPNWSRYRYQPGEARRLLEQAGCRRGADGIYVCAGERLRLRFLTTAGVPARELTLRLVQAHLLRVGVDVDLLYAPQAVLFDSILPSGDYDAVLFQWGFNPGGRAIAESRCGHEANWTGFCSRLIMRDVQQVDRIVDPRQRARVLNAADAKLVNAVPVLPLFEPIARLGLKTRVRGFVGGGAPANWVQNSEDWWLER